MLQQRTHPRWNLSQADTQNAVRDALEKSPVGFILTDVDTRGIFLPEIFRCAKLQNRAVPVFIMTRETDRFFQTLGNAGDVQPAGVFNFPSEVDAAITSIDALFSGANKTSGAANQIAVPFPRESAIPDPEGVSAHAVELRRKIKMAAESERNVLLLGETGSGKERAAHAIHAHSVRRYGPFKAKNVSALPSGLAETILFGSSKGSYTDAPEKKGLFESSFGGTVFLDEIGELDISLQPKLLRVLEEGMVCRVGSHSPVRTNFRLLCATNRDLRRAVDDGFFRKDLFYRINAIQIDIPPLRERPEDIFSIISETLNTHGKTLAAAALDKLENHHWPGNIRQLLNCVSTAAQKTPRDTISPDDIAF